MIVGGYFLVHMSFFTGTSFRTAACTLCTVCNFPPHSIGYVVFQHVVWVNVFLSSRFCGKPVISETTIITAGSSVVSLWYWRWRFSSCTELFHLLLSVTFYKLTAKCETRNLASVDRARDSIRGRPCKIFPHILFDHPAKFGCCFSYRARACRRSQKLGGRWAPPSWGGGVNDS